MKPLHPKAQRRVSQGSLGSENVMNMDQWDVTQLDILHNSSSTATERSSSVSEDSAQTNTADLHLGGASNKIKNSGKEKKQLSERDTWWMYSFRESPSPGAYEVRDFLQDAQLNPVKPSYNFKGQGRKKKPDTGPSGEMLLPGCYNIPNFLSFSKKLPISSSFKNTSRQIAVVGCKDKEINTDPCQYDLSAQPIKYFSCKQFMFRSTVKRFPSACFAPKDGPGPGDYHLKNDPSGGISSSFKSKVPRFVPFIIKTPGPGTYEPMRQLPKLPPTVTKMGRLHGIFFRNSFEF
ncbi:protein STPG4 [Bombina bombina]|uniref:protein STPG4 n=1 Tax=Bombina bombina TaxID=8345 RepID=UPI00235AAA0E|nr:protein STPG4 [Bombina bombina]